MRVLRPGDPRRVEIGDTVMDIRIDKMDRREFLKMNFVLAAAIAFLSTPLKGFADMFKRGPNISDKEARYYRRLAG